MTNEDFLLLTEEERNEKFKAVLTKKSRGGLTEKEIGEIIRILSTDQQYEIVIHHSQEEFCAGITRRDGTKKRLILGVEQVGSGMDGLKFHMQSGTVAVTVRKHTVLEECNELHIFIPSEHCEERMVV